MLTILYYRVQAGQRQLVKYDDMQIRSTELLAKQILVDPARDFC